MTIKPLWDRILLKSSPLEKQNDSGLYIPETANKEKPFAYEVLEIGKSDKITVQPWDKVLVWQYSWDDVKLWDEEFKIVGFDYVLAVLED